MSVPERPRPELRVVLETDTGRFVVGHGRTPVGGVAAAASRTLEEEGRAVWELALTGGPGLAEVDVDPGQSIAGWDVPEAARAVPRVRPGAYALLLRGGDPVDVLLTRLSEVPGAWTLPGGGIDPGEAPDEAVSREVHEETGLRFAPERLLGVVSKRFVAHSHLGVLEDFQILGLVYAGPVDPAAVPRVVEVGGSTADVRWVPWSALGELAVTPFARTVMEQWGPLPLPPSGPPAVP